MKKTKWIAVLAACMVALFAAGCDNGSNGSGGTEPEPVAVDSVDIAPKTLSLTVGEMGELKARILPKEAAGVTVQWSSSKETVATVGNDGVVKAVKVGRATITAQAGDKSDTCEVTVSAHTHYYVNFICRTCGWDKPSFKEGEIDDRGNLTAYTGSGTTVTIPKGVTCINSEVFKGKTSLTSVTLPEGMTRIEHRAFEGCTGLTSVTIPDGVTYIGWNAFSGCTSLASVTIPDSVTEINSSTFEGCTSLESVTILEGVTKIDSKAFYGCTSLASMTIPDSVTEIESSTFEGCTSLKEIQFNGTIAQWNAIAGSDGVNITCIRCSDGYIGVDKVPAYLKMDGRTVTGYTDGLPKDLVIPDGVTKISKDAFYNCADIESVSIPGSVTEIEGYTYLEHGAFQGCENLKTVTMAEGVKTIGNGTFWGCTSLTSVPIPDGVTEIGKYAFYKCTSLTEVTLPDGVTEIGSSAFERCESLRTVKIPVSVKKIGYEAFESYYYRSPNLQTVIYSGTEKQWNEIEKESDIIFRADRTITGIDENGNETTWDYKA